jgi:hypothetical protein
MFYSSLCSGTGETTVFDLAGEIKSELFAFDLDLFPFSFESLDAY